MATRAEKETPADIVKQQKTIQQQNKEVTNKQLPPGEVPAGNLSFAKTQIARE